MYVPSITNTNTQYVHTQKSEGFRLPHATAVNVDELSFFFHVSVGEWSYTISWFYKIKICLELEKLEQVTQKDFILCERDFIALEYY